MNTRNIIKMKHRQAAHTESGSGRYSLCWSCHNKIVLLHHSKRFKTRTTKLQQNIQKGKAKVGVIPLIIIRITFMRPQHKFHCMSPKAPPEQIYDTKLKMRQNIKHKEQHNDAQVCEAPLQAHSMVSILTSLTALSPT